MLALRLARGARPAVQLRRFLVAVASAGTGFLLLCALGFAMGHPHDSSAAALRLAWCLAPLAATVQFAVAVARTDPATRPRSGLSAIGLGPGRLMLLAAISTAVSCTLGSVVALLCVLHLRGDLSGLPFDGEASELLAGNQPLPLAATLTLLALVPLAASLASALALRPREGRPSGAGRTRRTGTRAAATEAGGSGRDAHPDAPGPPVEPHPAPRPTPTGLPWGVAVLAAGLAVETYASRSGPASGPALPGSLAGGSVGVLLGWALTTLGLAMAGPALTHLSGRLLQAMRPGALRLLAGRILMEEAGRIGRPLGVVCAVASGAYAMAALHADARPEVGPLTVLGVLLVAGCAVGTLLTAAVEAKHARADTTAALLGLGAPATLLRGAAALRAGALLAVLGPLTWAIAGLAAVPLAD
ncbi:hypothetical protein [Streptomyces flaveus]|uniref:Uncharacterized protein n=1 Tax=Streptomyces flaveus TaxID=66370 RepID=A0A917V8F3_9ACTN|nr:hypothetical protein [Streptomyces flaveus]GGK49365.1 hypothetical protein GCM10010094_06930 [Streptomyces flaveus]